MQIPNLWTRCASCRGRGIVAAGDVAALCPNCGGSGRAPLKVKRVSFDYMLPVFANLSASAAIQAQELQLDSDAPFEQTHWTLSMVGSTSTALGQALLSLVDKASGTPFMSPGGIYLANFACNQDPTGNNFLALGACLPFPLVVPFVWMPGASLLATLNYPAPLSSTNVIQVGMKGYKLYAPDGSPLALPGSAQQAAA